MKKILDASGVSQIFLIIIVALISSGIVGAGVWYWHGREIKKLEDSYKTGISKPKSTVSPSVSPSPSPSATPSESASCDLDLPVLVFEPGGLFTEAEKTEIRTKVTEPYFDYYNENSIEIVTLEIKKYAEDERPAGYMYAASAIGKDGTYSGWLFGKEGEGLSYWFPECMDSCPFSDTFRAEHPEVIEAYESAGGI